MKVEFTVDECHQMFEAVITSLNDLDMTAEDKYALTHWQTNDMKPGSVLMNHLAEKINGEVQGQHDRSEVSPIKKPDWA
jgi:hypothetical protein|tara:strand:+ start:4615 stop:4851 length:237 start_codon:yes stop_codon:yes gene_type:complete